MACKPHSPVGMDEFTSLSVLGAGSFTRYTSLFLPRWSVSLSSWMTGTSFFFFSSPAKFRRRIRNGCPSVRPAPSSDGKGLWAWWGRELGVWVSACLCLDLQSCCFSPSPRSLINSAGISEFSIFLCLCQPLGPLLHVLFLRCTLPLWPPGCGPSCLLYHESVWLAFLYKLLELCYLLWSFSCSLCGYGPVSDFIPFLLLCGAFRKENRERHDVHQRFFPAGYNNLRSTPIGLSYFLLALKIRQWTSHFLKGTWKSFEKNLHIYTFVKWIGNSVGISACTSYCQMFVTSDWAKFLSL